MLKTLNEADLRRIREIALNIMRDFPSSYARLPEFQEERAIQTYCFVMATSQYLKNKGLFGEHLTYKTKTLIIK